MGDEWKGPELRAAIAATLEAQGGVICAEPARVYRKMYTGRDVLGKNRRFGAGDEDERGYLPVEWWIMSATAAANDIPRAGEGITRIHLIGGGTALLTDARAAAGPLLFGEGLSRWPLTKVLDIGGEPVTPSYGGEPEVPPIPFHVHRGEVRAGRLQGPGKLEAYFFPPVDVPPYNLAPGRVVTRLGLRPGTTREQVLSCLRRFALGDDLYALGAAYEIRPYEGWTVRPGCLHAPGPWPTFEVQLPQDDYHFAAWRLGVRAAGRELEVLRERFLLRGLRDEEDFLRQAVDWELSTDPKLRRRYHRPSRELESGPWGRRLQIFFDEFYGEAIEVAPGARYTRPGGEAFAGILWSGEGILNGQRLARNPRQGYREFLVTPGVEAAFVNPGDITLRVYTVFPLRG